MSPEPTQEPLEQDLKAPNVSIEARAANDSDSEDEDAGASGYLPLSQIPTDSDAILDDDEDDEWISTNSNQIFPNSSEEETPQEPPSELVQVWTTPCERTNIDLDAEKINQVKSMMASFTLPTTAIPDWANAVSEEQWKDRLIDRLKEMQERES